MQFTFSASARNLVRCVAHTLLVLMLINLIAIQAYSQQTGGTDPNRNMNSSYFTSGNPYYTAPDPYNNNKVDGWLVGQCTWYVWGRCSEIGWNIHFTGNAKDYYDNVQGGSAKDLNPEVGAIMCLPSLSANGHIGVVIQVNDANSWVIDEYNINDGAPTSPEWSRETVTRDPNNSTRVKGQLFNWTTLKGFVHSPSSGNPDPTNIYVDGNYTGAQIGTQSQPFSTVTAAVNAADPSKAVTIHIVPHWYQEKITINKNIHIVPNGSGIVRIGA